MAIPAGHFDRLLYVSRHLKLIKFPVSPLKPILPTTALPPPTIHSRECLPTKERNNLNDNVMDVTFITIYGRMTAIQPDPPDSPRGGRRGKKTTTN